MPNTNRSRGATLVQSHAALIRLAAVSLLAVLLWPGSAAATDLGPFGPEGPRMREQLWLLPAVPRQRPCGRLFSAPPSPQMTFLALSS